MSEVFSPSLFYGRVGKGLMLIILLNIWLHSPVKPSDSRLFFVGVFPPAILVISILDTKLPNYLIMVLFNLVEIVRRCDHCGSSKAGGFLLHTHTPLLETCAHSLRMRCLSTLNPPCLPCSLQNHTLFFLRRTVVCLGDLPCPEPGASRLFLLSLLVLI